MFWHPFNVFRECILQKVCKCLGRETRTSRWCEPYYSPHFRTLPDIGSVSTHGFKHSLMCFSCASFRKEGISRPVYYYGEWLPCILSKRLLENICQNIWHIRHTVLQLSVWVYEGAVIFYPWLCCPPGLSQYQSEGCCSALTLRKWERETIWLDN